MQSNDINQAYATEQEAFWAGEFGNNYIGRNVSETYLASNIALFARILSKTTAVSSVLEFGANAGLNLQAIAQLLPSSELSAVEINQNAVQKLQQLLNGRVNVYHNSILDKELPPLNADFVLIKGVLIHINPEHLGQVYEKLFNSSRRYICIAEYYNPSPVEIVYRGHHNKLFKRDFAGEMLDKYSDLKLIDYGFVYHRDSNFPQDDTTWFLLEKTTP
ncbi:pseudaminic acid biosynthesis-associated methylase [Leptolyngbya iicbica]|uniref:Methyltransferase domain-containing protein n=2 Tax=Cyanophyceae TaxID=3028117 RepID=A0A4Q7EGA1_9CYAN|nr:pseudaminic acid biosynthesis-associated methylase [Leptolyngbya sp. LK]RZM82621.1 methyltransferase domain-containing protein [Leptolyngbya sp. LK]